MSVTQNKELLQQIFAELAKGNSRPLVESMADDFSWTVSGSTKWSRTYAGKQAVLNELFATLRSHMADRIKTIGNRLLLKVILSLSRLTVAIPRSQGSHTTTNIVLSFVLPMES